MTENLVLVPVQLQAFVLNPEVCGTGTDDDNGSRIIPITQPNYTFLRLDNFAVQSDVLNHADLHSAAPHTKNPRMTDLGATPNKPLRHRHGVYVHWILPQVYRSGVAAADKAAADQDRDTRLKRGLPAAPPTSTPDFLQPPTRWIVVRRLNLDSVEENVRDKFKEYQAWVIESDYLWTLDDIPLDYDLEVDVSPFVVGAAGDGANLKEQAEVFIGRKTPLEKWSSQQKNGKYTNISILRSGNQLFADFQLHNTNVFSILDNFEYEGPEGEVCYLDKADAGYYLLGWHSSEDADPLHDSNKNHTHSDRLQALFMSLADGGDPDTTQEFLKSKDAARLCLHGAVYDVKWDHSSKPPSVPADDFSSRVRNQDLPAVSIGTTPMDALITYCTARRCHEPDAIEKLEENILALDSLLHARDDGVEGQREAKDTVYNWNFSRSKGGTHYFIGEEDGQGKPARPSKEAIDALRDANKIQALRDACGRLAEQWRWEMFSIWWKFVSDVENKHEQRADTERATQELEKRLNGLLEYIASLDEKLKDALEAEALAGNKTGTRDFFYRARDPTLLIGGVDSGWPTDFSDNTTVRLAAQVIEPEATTLAAIEELAASILKAFPKTDPVVAAPALLKEFYALSPSQSPPKNPKAGHVYPQFFERWADRQPSRDLWGNRQPWFPLYVEWEVEYTHVPFEYWAMDEQAARLSDNKMFRYGIKVPGEKTLWEELDSLKKPGGDDKLPRDTRVLSGRVLVLPQPSFALEAKVKQLFADTPPQILEQYLSKPKRDHLLANIKTLSYLSCPLTGLTEGLLTLNQGTHIKPENKVITANGEESVPIKEAQYDVAGLTADRLKLIAGNSALTPFASVKDFNTLPFCPFKPVTHGQMRFRKLNVIDKFGQAIAAIEQKPRKEGLPPLYPAISDFYEAQSVTLQDGSRVANTVLPNGGTTCEFVQLPPQINQPARLNAEFVLPDEDGGPEATAYWRPATEWENPVWGWIVVNYADYGIQLFLPDGNFYGEVRIGGPLEALEQPKWAPFAPDGSTSAPRETARLDALIKRLKQPDYLRGFWTMITEAVDSLPPAPDAYAQFLGSIVGKPLALVTMGWSLELAGPPLTNQSTQSGVHNPERQLINRSDHHSYTFQFKLGDKEREYDGLVGYFDGLARPDKESGEELQYDSINTYFTGGNSTSHFKNLKPLSCDTYPTIVPTWDAPFPTRPTEKPISPTAYATRRNASLLTFGAIVDPFTAVHGYTSFLPVRELRLPPWTWQDAMTNLTAFFHAGPLLLPGDAATAMAYNDSKQLDGKKMREKPDTDVALPGTLAGEWSWVQPFDKAGADLPVQNAFGVDKKGNLMTPGFQQGPYTATEGYWLLRRPVMADKTD